MADEGDYNVNRTGTDDIDDVCRELLTEASVVHEMSTKQEARMADHGATREKWQWTGNYEGTWRT